MNDEMAVQVNTIGHFHRTWCLTQTALNFKGKTLGIFPMCLRHIGPTVRALECTETPE